MRPYTENERQRLIAFNRAIIEQHESYAIPVDLMPYHIRMMVYSARIALSSLEAEALHAACCDGDWLIVDKKTYISLTDKDCINPCKGKLVYTAAPVPVMRAVELPEGFAPSVIRHGLQSTRYKAIMSGKGDWLHKDQVIEAIRAAGGEVKK